MDDAYTHERSMRASIGSARAGGHTLAAITAAQKPNTANRCAALFIGVE
jgi:hypothetical protein